MGSKQVLAGRITGRELLVLLVLAAVHFANVMDFMIVMPLGPRYQADLHITPQEFGWLVSVYGFTSSLSGLLAASFLDRFDRKRTLLVLYGGFTLATFSCAASGNYYFLLIARGLAGVFGGVMASTVMAVVGDLFADARRGRAMGIVMSSFSVASIAGIPAGLFLANKLAWWVPFAAIGGMCVPVWLLVWVLLPTVRGHLHRRHVNALRDYRDVLVRNTHLRAYLLTTLLVMSSFLVVPFLTSYLVANVGRDESELFWIYLCGGLATLVTMTLIGWWADRWRKLPVFRLMAFATAIPLLLLTNLPHGTGLVVVLAYTTLFFVTSSGRMVPAMAMITASATPRHRGSFLSVNTAVSHMAMGLASILAGWILSDAASGAPLIHFPLIGALGALAAIASAILGGWIIPAPGGKDATVAVEGVPTHASVERNGEGTATAAPPDAVPA